LAPRRLFNHPLSPLARRTAYACLVIIIVMTIGTTGIWLLTGWDWVDSFYFMAMIATAQGPPNQPPNDAAKIFAAAMAFVSIGSLVTAIGTIFGPYLGYLFHKGVLFADREVARLETEHKENQDSEHKSPKS
jgi:hypothetical protein